MIFSISSMLSCLPRRAWIGTYYCWHKTWVIWWSASWQPAPAAPLLGSRHCKGCNHHVSRNMHDPGTSAESRNTRLAPPQRTLLFGNHFIGRKITRDLHPMAEVSQKEFNNTSSLNQKIWEIHNMNIDDTLYLFAVFVQSGNIWVRSVKLLSESTIFGCPRTSVTRHSSTYLITHHVWHSYVRSDIITYYRVISPLPSGWAAILDVSPWPIRKDFAEKGVVPRQVAPHPKARG